MREAIQDAVVINGDLLDPVAMRDLERAFGVRGTVAVVRRSLALAKVAANSADDAGVIKVQSRSGGIVGIEMRA